MRTAKERQPMGSKESPETSQESVHLLAQFSCSMSAVREAKGSCNSLYHRLVHCHCAFCAWANTQWQKVKEGKADIRLVSIEWWHSYRTAGESQSLW